MSYVLLRLNRTHVAIICNRKIIHHGDARYYADINKIKETAMSAVKSLTNTVQSLIQKGKGKKSSQGKRAAQSQAQPQVQQRIVSSAPLSFDNSKNAYAAKTNWELIRALIVYQICSVDYIVTNNKNLINVGQKVLGKQLFSILMKGTFYGQFVAGEDEYKIQKVLNRLNAFGIKAMLDYAVEDDMPSSKAKELEKKAVTSKNDTMKHAKQFRFSEKFADRRYKVDTARTFFYYNEASCERNMEYFLRCVEALSLSGSKDGITAIKVTALGKPQLLLQISEVIVTCRKFINELMGGSGTVISHHIKKEDLVNKVSKAKIQDKEALQVFLDEIEADSEGIIHIFPWSGIVNDQHAFNDTFRIPDVKTGKMVPLTSKLTKTEQEMFSNMIRRFDTVVKAAQVMGCRVTVDAEQTYFQPAISRLAVEFMRKYNKERHLVLNTYQTYLKDSLIEIKADLEQARRQKFRFGCKLVRGAYLEQERERAATLKYRDPTNPSYEATTEMYHSSISHIMQEHVRYKKEGQGHQIYLIIASHNEQSVKFGLDKMKKAGIKKDEKVVSFAQLLGMCDYLTFPLGLAGYSCYKYIPYGPVMYVLPYLSRRANENRGIMFKVQKEKRLLKQELKRRLMSGQVMYTPKA